MKKLALAAALISAISAPVAHAQSAQNFQMDSATIEKHMVESSASSMAYLPLILLALMVFIARTSGHGIEVSPYPMPY